MKTYANLVLVVIVRKDKTDYKAARVEKKTFSFQNHKALDKESNLE